MSAHFKRILIMMLPFIDLIFASMVFPAALLLKSIRRIGIHRVPLCRRILLFIGVLPIRKHYYEPFVDENDLLFSLEKDRNLPGIDFNGRSQLELLKKFDYNDEIKMIQFTKNEASSFYFDNPVFGTGDAEFFYNIIRFIKPSRIIEVGCGHSTLLAQVALSQNLIETPSYSFVHTCIEPYEQPWLERLTNINLIREKVEKVGDQLFFELEPNDILFIDSSHVIRPQGDILYEILGLLPILKPGVIVHFHDIFSPKDYPFSWIIREKRLWNEQYLLESFLTCNHEWKIIAALNYLHHNHYQELKSVCPILTPDREPGSFYIQKIS